MKKNFLWLLFILLIGMAGVSVQAKEITEIKTYELEKKRLDNIDEIKADLRYMDLEIKPSKDQHIYLSYKLHCKNEKNPFMYSVKDNVLNLKEEAWEGISWKKVSSKELKKYEKEYKEYMENIITLYIPSKSTLKKSIINMKDGNFLVKNIQCKYMDLNFKFGDINIEDVILGAAEININDGDINCKNTKAYEAITMTTKYGDINFSDCQIKKGIEIKTNDGDINCKNTKVSKAAIITTKYGDISVFNFQAGEEIKIKTSDGDVNIENIRTSEQINVSSNYGNIDISDLVTLKDIQVKTKDGDVGVKIKEEQLKQRRIIMDTKDGSLSVPSKLSDGKKKKKDGWHYEKDASSKKALLKITTFYGDISLR